MRPLVGKDRDAGMGPVSTVCLDEPSACVAARISGAAGTLRLLTTASLEDVGSLKGDEAFTRLVSLMPSPSFAVLVNAGSKTTVLIGLPGEPEVFLHTEVLVERFARMLLAEEVMSL